MSSNQCPVCQQEAMDAATKLMKRPHVCKNCGAELRMNLVYTAVLSLIYFFLSVRFLLSNGLSGQGMFFVLITTAVFIGACLYVPLEQKAPQDDT